MIRIYRKHGRSATPDLKVGPTYAAFDRPVVLSREAGDVLRTTLLPGLDITLRAVFPPHTGRS